MNGVGCSVIWKLFKLSTPVMIGMLMQSLFAMVDLYFVAKLGTQNASAIAIGASAFGTMLSITVLVTSATMAIGARASGAGDRESLKRYSALTTFLSLILGLFLGAVLYLLQEPLMALLYQPTPQTAQPLTAYLDILFLGFASFFLASNGRAILQAVGDTWTPLWVFGISNLVNMALDPLFIFTLDMGISGAALATVLANVLATLWLYAIVVKRFYEGQWLAFLRFGALSKAHIASVLRIGFWDALQSVARPVTGMLMFSMVYQLGGDAATAAFGIGGQLFNYTFIVLAGLSVSIGIFSGQAAGSGNLESLRPLVRQAFLVACANMVLFALPYLVFQDQLFGLFTEDPQVLRLGSQYLNWVYPGLCFVVLPTIISGIFKGVGATREPMIASLFANVVLKLPLAFVLSRLTPMGIEGIWLAISLSVVVEALIIGVYYRLGKWKNIAQYA